MDKVESNSTKNKRYCREYYRRKVMRTIPIGYEDETHRVWKELEDIEVKLLGPRGNIRSTLDERFSFGLYA